MQTQDQPVHRGEERVGEVGADLGALGFEVGGGGGFAVEVDKEFGEGRVG